MALQVFEEHNFSTVRLLCVSLVGRHWEQHSIRMSFGLLEAC
jgi:hypothetical protein